MGFFDKIKDKVLPIISAPVTVVPKVFSNIIDNVAPGNEIAAAVSNTFSAPFEFAQKGASLQDAIAQAKPGLTLAASAAGGPLGGALGLNTAGLGLVSNLLPGPVQSTTNPFAYMGTTQPTDGPVGDFSQQKNNLLVPIAVVGGGLILLIALRR